MNTTYQSSVDVWGGTWNATTVGPEWLTSLLPLQTNAAAESEVLSAADLNITTNITKLIDEFYNDFEYVSETYLMTTLAVLGIVLNALAMSATCRDRHARRMSRALHCLFYVAENFFLAGYVGFLQLRGHERRRPCKEHDIEVFPRIYFLHICVVELWSFMCHHRIMPICDFGDCEALIVTDNDLCHHHYGKFYYVPQNVPLLFFK